MQIIPQFILQLIKNYELRILYLNIIQVYGIITDKSEGPMANTMGQSKKIKAENSEILKLVTFQLGEELYGVEIMDVDQIVKIQEVRPIPNAPYYVEGIFTLRSEIIPIVSLHKRFHIKKAAHEAGDEFLGGFIILRIQDNKIGIVIDRVARVVDVKKDEIQPPPQMIAGIGAEYIHGVVRKDSGYLIILDIHRLFNPKELQKIQTYR